MKKILLIAAIAVSALTASAQTEAGRTRFSIGLEAGIPTGDAGDVYSVALGGSVQAEFPIIDALRGTLSAGYTSLTLKDEFRFPGVDKSQGFVPVKAGGKFFFLPNLFGALELGAAIGTGNNSETAFAWAPGVGISYPVADRMDFEAGVRYESWSKDNNSIDQIAFRVALKF